MHNLKILIKYSLVAAIVVAGAGSVSAEGVKTYEITLKGKAFTPSEIKVKAGERFRIKLTNNNGAPAELESSAMGFEKIVSGSSSIVVNVRAQKPGKYKFYDEFHEDDTVGHVIAE